MKVTNLTQNTYVLSGGVKLTPGVVDFVIADELFQSDSTLNIALGQMEFRGLISTDEVPDDPFPPKGTGLFTYIQTAPPSDQGDGDTWLRIAGGYPDEYGAGLFTWFNSQWNPVAPATLNGDGDVIGIVSVGPGDGNIVIEKFDADRNASGAFVGSGYLGWFTDDGNSAAYAYMDTSTFNIVQNTLLNVNRAQFVGVEVAEVPVTIAAMTNQEGNLLETYDVDGNLRLFVDPQGNLTIQNENGYAFMQTASDGSFGVSALTGFYIAKTAAAIELDTDDFSEMFVASKLGVKVRQQADTGGKPTLSIQPVTGGSSRILEVLDEDGNAVLTVNHDGTVHIKTGGTIHADL